MNVIGIRTLLDKEVRRFLRVPGQTVLSPLISTSLYFLVFGFTIGQRQVDADGAPYVEYIVPGLIFLGVSTNAYLNSSSSLFISKMQGTIVDLLVAPMGPVEILIGFVAGGMVRGILVGALTWGVALVFTPLRVAHPATALLFVLLTAYVFAVLGFITALWAEKFEHVNFFPTFVMMPLTFLGGVFYSIDQLREPFRTASLFNPVVHMVDGLRGGMLGVSQRSAGTGAAILLGLALSTTLVAHGLLRSGYKLRS